MDAAGFHSAWFPEIIFSDAMTPLTAVGLDTKQLMLGTGIVGPWSRSPAVMALTMSTLSHLCAQALPSPPGVYYPLYERHLEGAPFPELSFPEFLGGVQRMIDQLA